MDFLDYLEQLEAELQDKKGLFKKIDNEKCLGILEQMKLSYPDTMSEASYIVANKQRILESADAAAKKTVLDAEMRAENILAEADEKAKKLIDESNITKAAEEEAHALMMNTAARCESLAVHARDHLNQVFQDAESYFEGTLHMLHNNKIELENALGLGKKTDD